MITIKKYRKKPLIIEAVHFDGGDETHLDICRLAQKPLCNINREIKISTLEGDMICRVGDYCIKGIKGEIYPCRADIFEETYELVEDDECPTS